MIEQKNNEKNMDIKLDFEITVNGFVFNEIIKLLKIESNEIRFMLGKDGIKVTTIDPSHVSMLNIVIPIDVFINYNVKENTSLTIDLKRLPKIRDDKTVYLSRIQDKFKIHYNNMVQEIPELDYYSVSVPRIPDLSSKDSLIVKTESLKNFIFESAKISNDMKIEFDNTEVNNKKIILTSASDKGKIECKLYEESKSDFYYDFSSKDSYENKEKVISHYSLDYLNKLMKNMNFVNEIKIKYKTNYPMEIDFELPEINKKNAKGTIPVRYFLANRYE